MTRFVTTGRIVNFDLLGILLNWMSEILGDWSGNCAKSFKTISRLI